MKYKWLQSISVLPMLPILAFWCEKSHFYNIYDHKMRSNDFDLLKNFPNFHENLPYHLHENFPNFFMKFFPISSNQREFHIKQWAVNLKRYFVPLFAVRTDNFSLVFYNFGNSFLVCYKLQQFYRNVPYSMNMTEIFLYLIFTTK